MFIDDDLKNKIIDAAKIVDIIPNLTPAHGQQFYRECPACQLHDTKKKKGLMINPDKNLAKCFSCGAGFNAVSWLTDQEKLTFPEALKKLADTYNILIPDQEEKPKGLKLKTVKVKAVTAENIQPEQPKHASQKMTFCDIQLHESGLTYDDIRVESKEDEGQTTRFVSPFLAGTRTQYGQITEGTGDDVLIKYYDLEGRPVMFKPEKSDKMKELIRIRWQNPLAHTDRNGKAMKYQSPAGSGSHIYIPEKIRQMYRTSRPIARLFIQEGEKKAEKACKHGIPSIGIMGIQNLGSNKRLPEEIQLIIQRCDVKEVVFMLDSDWNHLSDNLKIGESVDIRCKQFFSAVKNYKDYMRTLVNLHVSVEIYFGHVKENKQNEKGIDDLLTGSLKTEEMKLALDIDFAMHAKDGAGSLVNIWKITQESDQKIADHWLINDAEKFAQYHKEQLKTLAEFKVNGFLRRFNEKGDLELTQQLLPEEKYWDEITNARSGEVTLKFHYVRATRFLMNRGFFNYRMQSGQRELINIKNKVVHRVDHLEIKEFVKEFTKEIKREDILNMLFQGGPQYLGPEKLSNLDLNNPKIERAEKHTQHLFFTNKIWEVTANGTKEMGYNQLANSVWSDNIISAEVCGLKPLVSFSQLDGTHPDFPQTGKGDFMATVSDEGKKCHFLRFLMHTSDFHWRKNNPEYKGERVTYEEEQQATRHVLNKLTAIGYLLHDYKNYSELKAVIAMDGKLSEVGSSHGRSGKSLVGKAIEYVIPQVYIDAKRSKLTEDAFLWQEVTEKTRNVFLDDARAGIDFEHFFPVITGRMLINTKGTAAYTLSERDTPKLLITTNHSVLGEGASFTDRQSFMVFSDYYNDTRKPIHDFGVNFFSEWDNEQWNLFYNLMATCLQLYFQSQRDKWDGADQGIVQPPMESVQKRQLRQLMGENFLIWADAVFCSGIENRGTTKLNIKQVRKELQEDFLDKNPNERKYMTPSQFSKRIKAYCKYYGYHLNPDRHNDDGLTFTDWEKQNTGTFIGTADKSGGIEYMTIANDDFKEEF